MLEFSCAGGPLFWFLTQGYLLCRAAKEGGNGCHATLEEARHRGWYCKKYPLWADRARACAPPAVTLPLAWLPSLHLLAYRLRILPILSDRPHYGLAQQCVRLPGPVVPKSLIIRCLKVLYKPIIPTNYEFGSHICRVPLKCTFVQSLLLTSMCTWFTCREAISQSARKTWMIKHIYTTKRPSCIGFANGILPDFEAKSFLTTLAI